MYARLPVLRILVGLALVGALVALAQLVAPRAWALLAALALYVAVSVGGSGYAALIQRLVVLPNEQEKETPFIQNNIRATREALRIDL